MIAAGKNQRNDLADAIYRSMRLSRMKRKYNLIEKANALSHILDRTPIFWRFSPLLRRYLR